MTTNTNNSTTPASAPIQFGTPGKTLAMTPQVKQSIAAIRSAYNTYRQRGGKESIRAWLQPQIEEVLKERQTTSAQTLQNKGAKREDKEDVSAGTVLGILVDAALLTSGPFGLIVGIAIDAVVEGGDGSADGGGGSGDGSHGDNPGGGGSPA